MPYTSLSEANIKNIDGVPLTLAQANLVAEWADKIGGDKAWPFAISSFKKTHTVKDGKWVNKEDSSSVVTTKEADGRYKIIAVSTAALPDREKETFTTSAMDYDASMAALTGEYPEFRVFHAKPLGIGRVEKMSRVGIFAVDEGHSYTDPFSLAVCEKMLSSNDGKWRVSRGFYVLEASGGCPKCGSILQIRAKHMVAGYRCPVCKSTHLQFKGVLDNVHFLKTKTFDDTITDIPCVPFTGVAAFRPEFTEVTMTKEQLKERLLAAGLAADVVDQKLATVSEAQLKEFDAIPEATLLKEFQPETPAVEKTEPAPAAEQEVEMFQLDPETIKEFAEAVRPVVTEVVTEQVGAIIETKVKELLEGMSVEVPDVSLKEAPEIVAITQTLAEIKELLTADVDKIVKEKLEGAPRNSGLRIMRFKSKKTPLETANGSQATDDEEENDEEGIVRSKKEQLKEGVVYDQEGNIVPSMTQFLHS